MLLFWILPSLLAIATVTLVRSQSDNVLSKCDSSTAYLEVADSMVRKAKTCVGSKCDSSTVYLEVVDEMIKKAGTCATEKNDSSTVYLEVAGKMAMKAKLKCTETPTTFKPKDCSEVAAFGTISNSGVYKVWPKNRIVGGRSIDVYCDMDTDGGGWTVIQRRGNFSNPTDYFYKDWNSYRRGFGNISKEFWLGNNAIYALSTQARTQIRFDLQDARGTKKFALYDAFWIDDELNRYRLHVSGYSGAAGDSFSSPQNNQTFSTVDPSAPVSGKKLSCVQKYKGGWWYKEGWCYESNLNGLYGPGKYAGNANRVVWGKFNGYQDALLTTEMKLRPKEGVAEAEIGPPPFSEETTTSVTSSTATPSTSTPSTTTPSPVISSSETPNLNSSSSETPNLNASSSET